jgi:hypothetical protein
LDLKTYLVFLLLKLAKSETVALAPDCSGNPFADFSSAKDWNGKRGENDEMKWNVARPNNYSKFWKRLYNGLLIN